MRGRVPPAWRGARMSCAQPRRSQQTAPDPTGVGTAPVQPGHGTTDGEKHQEEQQPSPQHHPAAPALCPCLLCAFSTRQNYISPASSPRASATPGATWDLSVSSTTTPSRCLEAAPCKVNLKKTFPSKPGVPPQQSHALSVGCARSFGAVFEDVEDMSIRASSTLAP